MNSEIAKSEKEAVIYVGLTGFPNIKSAMINKITMISKGLVENNFNVVVLNRRWPSQISVKEHSLKGEYDNIRFDSVFKLTKKPNGFLKRNIIKLITPFFELKKIRSLIKQFKSKYIIVNSRAFFPLLYYVLIAKLKKQKVFLTYVEQESSFSKRSIFQKVNDYFFKNYAFKIINGALPISDYLIKTVNKRNKNLPVFKTPVLTDYDFINSISSNNAFSFFLFCGTAGHLEIIQFVVRSFEKVNSNTVQLKLICSGSSEELKKLKKIISESTKSDLILLESDVPYKNLIQNYKSAIALLIPLRKTIQDLARFPHKIGEYAASGRPIITNNYGEIANYFEHMESAVLVEDYKTCLYADAMDFILTNSEKANELGIKGKSVAYNYFYYKTFAPELVKFIRSV